MDQNFFINKVSLWVASGFRFITSILVDGAWTPWSAWSSCTVSCGGGKQTRGRTCTDPSPAHGGALCVGDENESKACNTIQCEGIYRYLCHFLSTLV